MNYLGYHPQITESFILWSIKRLVGTKTRIHMHIYKGKKIRDLGILCT